MRKHCQIVVNFCKGLFALVFGGRDENVFHSWFIDAQCGNIVKLLLIFARDCSRCCSGNESERHEVRRLDGDCGRRARKRGAAWEQGGGLSLRVALEVEKNKRPGTVDPAEDPPRTGWWGCLKLRTRGVARAFLPG